MTAATLVCSACGKPVERTFDDSPEVVDFQHVATDDGSACNAWPVRPVRAGAET